MKSSSAVTLPPPATDSGRTKLGELLLASGVLTRAQLDHALVQQRQLKLPLGKVLIKLNYLTDDRMRQTLSTQLNIPYIDLDKMMIDRSLARLINRGYAKRHLVLPVAHFGNTLTVAMDDPTATNVVDELRQLTHYTITVVTTSARAIQQGFSRLYDEQAEAPETSLAPELLTIGGQQESVGAVIIDEQTSKRADELFRAVLFRALQERTSDLHLEMLSGGLQVRFRVDGVLRQPNLDGLQWPLNKSAREVVSRIKILSKLDISERRRPQDGSFQVSVDRDGQKVNIDLRVSCIPSHSGESVVIRVLDRARAPRSLEDLNLSTEVFETVSRVLRRTTGIFLVTGPTGSGKSTTLYSCLMRLHRPEVRILTAEDPVEYVYDELSQSEVNDAIGNTFAQYLRSFLRHDPEVIMVGEIRDEETAEMAFRAAQTGHLLLSTMHTNSAITALPRLTDLKIESSLIASSLIGVLSQRLVRKVCPQCVQPVQPPEDQVREFFTAVPEGLTFVQGSGCPACGFTGYRGRMAIVDLWVPDEEDALLITKQAPFTDVKRSAERTTFSMAQDAFARLQAGATTLEELLRVLPYSAIAEHRARFSAPGHAPAPAEPRPVAARAPQAAAEPRKRRGMERRQHARVTHPLEGHWSGASGSGVCRVMDIGLGGCFIQTLVAPSVGEPTSVTIAVDGHDLILKGRVTYVEARIGFAMHFDELPAEAVERLRSLIDALKTLQT